MPIAIAYSSYPEIRLLKADDPLQASDFELSQALELDTKLLYLLLDATGASLPDGVLNGDLLKEPYLLHLAVAVDHEITFQPAANLSVHHSVEAAFKHLVMLREADNPPTL